ncbi:MAG: hypothetical protein HYU36_11765 [Planctomycetes bacterium]|nr:hypothetical protein [Planctomycetota bacterium]
MSECESNRCGEGPQQDGEKKKESFADVLEHLSKAAAIAAVLGEEKFNQLVSDLREQGEKISQKSEQIGQKAKERVERQKKSFEDWLGDRLAAAMARQQVATKEDIERLEKLIQEMRQR